MVADAFADRVEFEIVAWEVVVVGRGGEVVSALGWAETVERLAVHGSRNVGGSWTRVSSSTRRRLRDNMSGS